MSHEQDGRTLRAVTAIYRMINAGQSQETTLDFISEQVARQLQHKFCAISLYDPAAGTFEIRGSYGLSQEYISASNEMLATYLREEGTSSKKSVTLRAFATRSIIKIESLNDSWEFDAWHYLAQKAGYQSAIFLPLQFGQEVIGTMACYDDHRTYDQTVVTSLNVVAEQASTAVGLSRSLYRQEQTIEELEHQAALVRQNNDDLRHVSDLADSLTALLLRTQVFEVLLEKMSETIGRKVTFHPTEPPRSQDSPTRVQEVIGSKKYGFVSYPVGPLSDELDSQILRQIAVLCALHFSREEASLERELRQRSDVLIALLTGDEPSRERTQVLLSALQVVTGTSYRIGILRSALNASATNMARTFLADARYPHALLGEDLVVLAPAAAFTREGFKGLPLSASMRKTWQKLQFFASKPTRELDRLRDLYREVLGASLIINASLSAGSVIFMEDWPVHRLAIEASADPYFRERSSEIAGILYQPQHTELLRTIVTYFESDLSKVETARKLHIHVNTVKQRLQRAYEVIGLSMGNLDDIMELRLAILTASVSHESKGAP